MLNCQRVSFVRGRHPHADECPHLVLAPHPTVAPHEMEYIYIWNGEYVEYIEY